MKSLAFLRYGFTLKEKNFTFFFKALFLTTILSYVNYIFPFLPSSIVGFNWSGIAWILMLLVTIVVLARPKNFTFPLFLWMPWALYLVIYVSLEFTAIGLQLTLQYLLPILIGVVASQFDYTSHKLLYLFQWLLKTSVLILILFFIYVNTRGDSPNEAATPMFFSVGAVIGLGLFFYTRERRYLFLYFLLFLMPFLSVTRMGLLVFSSIFILHFSNKGLGSKVLASFVGFVLLLFVMNSKGFQEKTFFEGKGGVSELSFDYYNNDNVNSNGRSSLQNALSKGIEKNPIWGNGPRADASVLGEVIGKESAEAHNDYMSVTYNYGYVGLGFLLFGFGASFLQLLQMSKKMKHSLFQVIIGSQLTLFIPFLFFMYSDNILKYTIWFPNYFFALMGICFSMYAKKSF
jgi:hypothetical protein